MSNDALQNPTLVPGGLRIGNESLPLHAGSMHYFRLARSVWQPALESLHALGVRFVDIPIPWSIHETAPGAFDFGESNPRLDVPGFIELAARAGLRVIVRLGPLLGGELPFDGIPERVVWDEASQSRTRSGAPRVTATLPVAYPAPSHASRAFHEHAAIFLCAVAERLAPFAKDGGPVALAIVGDEHRVTPLAPGISGGDHHPDAVAQYRRFLKHRYGSLSALRRVHGADAVFDALDPPRGTPEDLQGLGPHLDWLEAEEAIVEGAFYRYRAVLDRHGLKHVPKLFQQSDVQALAPADPARMERVANGVSFECRASATEEGRRAVARVAGQAVARARLRHEPVFASKTYAGFAADMKPRADADDLFVAMTALAYGVRGLSLHEGVQRDRWIGGPIDAHGRTRPSAEPWRRLFAALDRVRHPELERRTRVRVVVPRLLERLGWLTSATAPLATTFLGGGPESESLEGDADSTRGALAEAREFLATVERVLDERRIPFELVSAEGADRELGDGHWTIFVCPGALEATLTSAIAEQLHLGKPISVGPRAPERDGRFTPNTARLPSLERTPAPLLLPRGPATLTELIATTLHDLGVEALHAEPDCIRTTLHVDSDGRPRALFVINPSEREVSATVGVPDDVSVEDALSSDVLPVQSNRVSLVIGAHTVRLLALAPAL